MIKVKKLMMEKCLNRGVFVQPVDDVSTKQETRTFRKIARRSIEFTDRMDNVDWRIIQHRSKSGLEACDGRSKQFAKFA